MSDAPTQQTARRDRHRLIGGSHRSTTDCRRAVGDRHRLTPTSRAEPLVAASRTSISARSSLIPPPSSLRRPGLGAIELLALVAVLVIAFALMASTARHVRSSSAMELTRKRMKALTDIAADLMQRGVDPTVAVAFPSTTRGDAELEDKLGRFAVESSRRLGESVANHPDTLLAQAIGTPELRDAWGRPIALLPGAFPAVGMAPDDGAFLVSAGPDGRFLTLGDNIYSYDLPALLPRVAEPATNPVADAAGARNRPVVAGGQPE